MSIAQTERMKDYGHPKENFTLVGKMWGSYLDREISAKDVAVLMVLFKAARLKKGYKKDTVEDIRGYADCMDMLETSINHFA